MLVVCATQGHGARYFSGPAFGYKARMRYQFIFIYLFSGIFCPKYTANIRLATQLFLKMVLQVSTVAGCRGWQPNKGKRSTCFPLCLWPPPILFRPSEQRRKQAEGVRKAEDHRNRHVNPVRSKWVAIQNGQIFDKMVLTKPQIFH